jgi:hypothetical protein
MTKKAMLLTLLTVTVLAIASTSFAATSVASLKGVYRFQIAGVSNQNGYYSGNTWYQVAGACPSGQHCFVQAFLRFTYGTVSFDGAGHATFLSITSVNGGSGGAAKGAVWAYSVSDFDGAMSTATNGAYLRLASFNSAGVATVVAIRTADNNPDTGVGVATLQ